MNGTFAFAALVAIPVSLAAPNASAEARPAEVDPLPSWNDGAVKRRILAFVRATTDRGGPDYVRPEDRIATFDQDGTLWVSHPLYTQAVFALDRVAELAPEHPEWRDREPFKTVLFGDEAALARLTEQDVAEILAATHAGTSTDEFRALVEAWLARAKDPRFQRPYTELAYLPMLELLGYLRANGFRTYVVTGGGQEFVRVYSEEIYGVPPEQVIGSSIATRYEVRGGKPVLVRDPEVFFVDDKGGKPVGIHLFVGKRPILAFGNSDGDREMLEWTTGGGRAGLGLLLLHTDAAREYAYGPAAGLPDTRVGAFSQALLDEAKRKGWIVVDMKRDWKRVFRAEGARPGKRRRTR
jgi:hypothetical protein